MVRTIIPGYSASSVGERNLIIPLKPDSDIKKDVNVVANRKILNPDLRFLFIRESIYRAYIAFRGAALVKQENVIITATKIAE
jgi:hypothetical protein